MLFRPSKRGWHPIARIVFSVLLTCASIAIAAVLGILFNDLPSVGDCSPTGTGYYCYTGARKPLGYTCLAFAILQAIPQIGQVVIGARLLSQRKAERLVRPTQTV